MSSPTDEHDLATEALYREFGACDADEDLQDLLDVERRLRELGCDDRVDLDGASGDTDLGRFERHDLIGRGGQSLVFRAMDPRLDREVAIKVHTAFDGAGGLRRLVHEARALAHLDLPGVVRIHDAYEEDGRAFVVMESVDGPPLSEVIDALAGRGARPSEQVRALARELRPIEARCRLVRDLARSLFAVHERGVIHRDVKPANVLVEPGPRPKWIDFGLSHKDGTATELTSAFLIGTPAYISPEQVKNRRTGASALSDQFSLGVLFYELLTLTSPFKRETREETLDAIAACAPRSPRSVDTDIPPEVERIVLHALEPVPTDRYDDAGALAADLDAFLEHRPISLGAPTLVERATKFVRRNRREVRLGSYTTLAVSALAAAYMLLGAWQSRSRTEARLNDIVGGLTTETTRPEAYRLFGALKELARDELDRRGPFSALLPPEGLEQGLDRASQWLFDAMSTEERRCLEENIPFDPSRWQDLLDIEFELRPKSTVTARYRDLGTLTYPPRPTRFRLQRVVCPVQGRFPELDDSIPTRRLPPLAVFRAAIVSPNGRVEREHVFFTGSDLPRIDVLSRNPAQRSVSRCTELSFGPAEEFESWISEHPAWNDEPTEWDRVLFARKFLISPRPVTWREIDEVLGEPLSLQIQVSLQALTGGPLPQSIPSELMDTFARVCPETAFRYAHAVGMRFPTALELVYAKERCAEFQVGDLELTCWPDSTPGHLSGVEFGPPRETSPLAPYHVFRIPVRGLSTGTTFRVALSVEP